MGRGWGGLGLLSENASHSNEKTQQTKKKKNKLKRNWSTHCSSGGTADLLLYKWRGLKPQQAR